MWNMLYSKIILKACSGCHKFFNDSKSFNEHIYKHNTTEKQSKTALRAQK